MASSVACQKISLIQKFAKENYKPSCKKLDSNYITYNYCNFIFNWI